MIAIAFGQRHQTRAVEVNAIELNEVGILIRISSPGPKPNLSFFFVNAIDAAHDKLAFGNLVLDLSSSDIDEIEMAPAIAFGSINDGVAVREPIDVRETKGFVVSGPDEGGAFFV